MSRVLLIGHDPDEMFGVAPKALADVGVDVTEHRSGGTEPLPDGSAFHGVVVFGGVMNVDSVDRHPFLADERRLVREAVDRGTPVLGICLGAQMLARAMERPVYPAPVREIGFNALHPTRSAADDRLLSVFEDGDMVFHWHEDTFELPEGAALLATGDDVHVQAFRVGDHAWGVQFHLEIDRPELDLWLDIAGEDEVRRWGKPSVRILEEADRHLATQEDRARQVFARFAEITRSAT